MISFFSFSIAAYEPTMHRITLKTFESVDKAGLWLARTFEPSLVQTVCFGAQIQSEPLGALACALFADAEQMQLPRHHFTAVRGKQTFRRISADNNFEKFENNCDQLACLAALEDTWEEKMGAEKAMIGNSVRVVGDDDAASAPKMTISLASAHNLEIVANAVDGGKRDTLWSIFPTCTSGGNLLLRRELLAPPCSLREIDARHAAVAQLMQHEAVCGELKHLLTRELTELTRVTREWLAYGERGKKIGALEHANKQRSLPTLKTREKRVRNLIALKQLLTLLPQVSQLLRAANDDGASALLREIGAACNKEVFASAIAQIETVLSPDAALSRSAAAMRHQLAFAVRANVDGLLDVARKTYGETLLDANELIEQYRLETGIQSLRLNFTVARGHHISLPPLAYELPDEFVQVQKQSKRWRCSTAELLSLSQRNAESMHEILIITDRVVGATLAAIADSSLLASLLAASEHTALLDMLLSFVTLARRHGPFVRAEFVDTASLASLPPIAIKEARHPLLLANAHNFSANDIYLADAGSVQLICGENASGKSTLLRQTALLVIMAHIGSRVPAAWCSMRVIDSLFARLGDDGAVALRNSASSFFQECAEVADAASNASAHSLVLVDELGRATSLTDGTALAWATAEHFALRTRALVQFVSHFAPLHALAAHYSNVRLCVMDKHHLTQVASIGAQRAYGIETARSAGLPATLINDARVIRAQLDEKALAQQSQLSQQHSQQRSIGARNAAADRLLALRFSSLQREEMHQLLTELY